MITLKPVLITAWRAELEARLAGAESGQQSARQGTRVDGSHRPANRGERGAVTAQGYLALGLGQRAAALEEQLRLLDEMGDAPRHEVVVGALVQLAVDDEPARWVVVLPGGDATWLEVSGAEGPVRVQVLSAASPLIRQLRDCAEDDAVEVHIGGRSVDVEVLQIG